MDKNTVSATTAKNIRELIRDNKFLFMLVGIGTIVLATGIAIGNYPPYHEIFIAIGAALIIAGGVATYMMSTTRQVAKSLHERFNEQNVILGTHTKILKEIASTLKSIDGKLDSKS